MSSDERASGDGRDVAGARYFDGHPIVNPSNKYCFGKNVVTLKDKKSIDVLQRWLVNPPKETSPTAISAYELAFAVDHVKSESNASQWFVHQNCFNQVYWAGSAWSAIGPELKFYNDTPGNFKGTRFTGKDLPKVQKRKSRRSRTKIKTGDAQTSSIGDGLSKLNLNFEFKAWIKYGATLGAISHEYLNNNITYFMKKQLSNDQFYDIINKQIIPADEVDEIVTSVDQFNKIEACARLGLLEFEPETESVDHLSDDPPDRVGTAVAADTLPFRQLKVSSLHTSIYESQFLESTPYTAVFQQLSARLNDTDASSALRSMLSKTLFNNASALLYLTDKMTKFGGSYRDVAPLCVCQLIINSLEPSIYQTTNPSPTVGDLYSVVSKPKIIPWPSTWGTPAIRVCIVHFSTAMNWIDGTIPLGADKTFSPAALDQTWRMVPFDMQVLQQKLLIPLVMSFIDSSIWNGRINILQKFQNLGLSAEAFSYDSASYIPASNSVSISGVRDIMLVYTPGDAPTGEKFIISDDITIDINDGRTAPVPVDIFPAISAWFAPGREGVICDYFRILADYLSTRLCVGDTAGRATSLVSELSLATPPGKFIKHDSPNDLNGAWSWKRDDKYGKYTVDWLLEGVTAGDSSSFRKRMIGYNFSLLSPLHQYPLGVVKTATVDRAEDWNDPGSKKKYAVARAPFTFWATNTPQKYVTQYQVMMSSSLNRLGTFMYLIAVNLDRYVFQSSSGMQSFSKMVGCAIYDATSAFLQYNDLSTRQWSGLDDDMDASFRNIMVDITRDVTLDMVIHSSPLKLRGFGEWSFDTVTNFYSVNLTDYKVWGSYSVVPIFCAQQWADKFMLDQPQSCPPAESVFVNGARFLAIYLNKCRSGDKSFFNSMLNDLETALPKVKVRSNYVEKVFTEVHWVNNFFWTSVASIPYPGNMGLSSYTYNRSITNLSYFDTVNNDLYLISGLWMNPSPLDYKIYRTSDLRYPDPLPEWLSNAFSWIRDYIAHPAVSGAKTFLATGSLPEAGKEALSKVEQHMDSQLKHERELEQKKAQNQILTDMPNELQAKAALVSTPPPDMPIV